MIQRIRHELLILDCSRANKMILGTALQRNLRTVRLKDGLIGHQRLLLDPRVS